MVWGSIFYFFMSDKVKAFFSDGIWILCGTGIVNYMLFGKNLGILSSNLRYDDAPVFTKKEYIVNTLVVLGLALALHFFYVKLHKIVRGILIAGCVAVIPLFFTNFDEIWTTYQYDTDYFTRYVSGKTPSFQLSTEGQNVIVLMLDRGSRTSCRKNLSLPKSSTDSPTTRTRSPSAVTRISRHRRFSAGMNTHRKR